MAESQHGKYILTEDRMPPFPPAMVEAMERQERNGATLDRTMLLGIMNSIVPGRSLFAGREILWGLPGGKPVEIEKAAHSHEFDEVIGFVGTGALPHHIQTHRHADSHVRGRQRPGIREGLRLLRRV